MSPRARTVLTTGANSGIGLATVLALARAGFRSVGSVRSEEKAEAVRRAAKQAGLRVNTVVLDVTNANKCRHVIDKLAPYGIVNNAGYGVTAAVEDVGDEEARSLIETMVIAPMRLARLALPHMRGRRDGRIINVSSIYGRTTTPLSGWYQAAKHALEGVSDALRMEVASDGIRVVLVEPGGFKTAIWDDMERSMAARKRSRYAAAYRRSLSGIRWSQALMGDPAAVARVIVRAMSARAPAARYLVGYDAQLLALAEPITPTALKDWISRVTLGL
ncbi:MAG TPA: SDR family NAD(P)-dependent oxidoreductase [Candidatus Binatia bacterium]|nr:SDR family NAD(P)-dependent oxidoreductase [Candidatus Binatia bacterium]